MLCEELIFEQVLLQLQQEVPYETAVHIQRFEDLRHQHPARCSLLADIWVTRESQKALVLGKQGQKIREMGTRARQRIEKLLGCAVYLELYVQVKPGWQNSRALLRELGFSAEVTSWTTQNHVL
jgi:GTP-binding protein Era